MTVTTTEILTRVCTRCQQRKTWAEFPVRTRWEDGTVRTVLSECRRCKSKRDAAQPARRTAAYRAYGRRWAREKRARERRERFMPAKPLQEFLATQGREVPEMVKITGVSERTLRRVMAGKQTAVGLGTADAVITRLGGVLECWYPFEGNGR